LCKEERKNALQGCLKTSETLVISLFSVTYSSSN